MSFSFLTKSVPSGIFFSNSVLSVSNLVFKINLLVLILFILPANLWYIVFLATFFTTLLSLLQSSGAGTNLSMSNLSTSFMWNIFNSCFYCIIWKINFNVNAFAKWLIWFRIKFAHFCIVKSLQINFIFPAIKWIIITFPFSK